MTTATERAASWKGLQRANSKGLLEDLVESGPLRGNALLDNMLDHSGTPLRMATLTFEQVDGVRVAQTDPK